MTQNCKVSTNLVLASGAHSDDLQRVWNQANLDRPEGIENLAAVLGMSPEWTMCDWVDVEARDTFEQFLGADEFTTLCFRLVMPQDSVESLASTTIPRQF